MRGVLQNLKRNPRRLKRTWVDHPGMTPGILSKVGMGYRGTNDVLVRAQGCIPEARSNLLRRRKLSAVTFYFWKKNVHGDGFWNGELKKSTKQLLIGFLKLKILEYANSTFFDLFLLRGHNFCKKNLETQSFVIPPSHSAEMFPVNLQRLSVYTLQNWFSRIWCPYRLEIYRKTSNFLWLWGTMFWLMFSKLNSKHPEEHFKWIYF